MESYRYTGPGKATWMDQCLFSKRGICIKQNRNNKFVVCEDCFKCLKSKKHPAKGIANGFYFGIAPKELTDLG